MDYQRLIVVIFNLFKIFSFGMVFVSSATLIISIRTKDMFYFWAAVLGLVMFHVSEYTLLMLGDYFGI